MSAGSVNSQLDSLRADVNNLLSRDSNTKIWSAGGMFAGVTGISTASGTINAISLAVSGISIPVRLMITAGVKLQSDNGGGDDYFYLELNSNIHGTIARGLDRPMFNNVSTFTDIGCVSVMMGQVNISSPFSGATFNLTLKLVVGGSAFYGGGFMQIAQIPI